jgi:hypothetical protein
LQPGFFVPAIQAPGASVIAFCFHTQKPREPDTTAQFDTEIAFARSHVNNSPIPDEVISGLENYVKTWNMIRTEPNQD